MFTMFDCLCAQSKTPKSKKKNHTQTIIFGFWLIAVDL